MKTVEIEAPYYRKNIIPENPSIELLHQEFDISMETLLNDIDLSEMFDKNSIEYYQQKYPDNKFIIDCELDNLVHFWGLRKGIIENYIGDLPIKNQKDIYDFYEKLDQDQKDYKPIIVSTPDVWVSESEIDLELYKKEVEQYQKINSYQEKINIIKSKLVPLIQKDPIVLFCVGLVESKLFHHEFGNKQPLWAIVTTWGGEKDLL